MQVENVFPDITKEISDIGKKLLYIGNDPHDDNEGSRDIENSPAHVIDVPMHVDSATREIGENPFELLFFLPDMQEEKNDVLSSQPDMHEEKIDVVSSLREVHPPAIVDTFSAFVLKRRAFDSNPAQVVDNDGTLQRTKNAGEIAGIAAHPETCDACMLKSAHLTG